MSEIKEWQMGYDIDFLKNIENQYTDYNSYTLSPFAKYKKNDIAADLHENRLQNYNGLFYSQTEVRVHTPINMYGNIRIGYKEKGDLVISKLSKIPDDYLFVNKNKNVWINVWAEDKKLCESLNLNGFEYVGSKITTFGEIYAIYYMTRKNSLVKKISSYIDPIETITCKKIGSGFDLLIINTIIEKLETIGITYTDHYSNYNAKHSWSAFSLRGYYPDPAFIAKPIEMNDKWKEQHKDEKFFLQDTVLYEEFSIIKSILSLIFDGEIHRVRFMKLSPGGGELRRHTDQVDPDAGNGLGKLARIHIPIITNDQVEFTTWNLNGYKICDNMKVGEMWLLDTRKPHRVINGGDSDRIHLVIDTIVTKKLYEDILNYGIC